MQFSNHDEGEIPQSRGSSPVVHISLRSFAVVILALLASCSAVEDEQTCRPRLEMIRELKWAMDSLLLDWEGTSSLRSCSQSWMSARHLNGPHVPSPFLFQTYYKCILYHSVHGIKASSYLYSVTSITGRKSFPLSGSISWRIHLKAKSGYR